jgi:hypothetical protein
MLSARSQRAYCSTSRTIAVRRAPVTPPRARTDRVSSGLRQNAASAMRIAIEKGQAVGPQACATPYTLYIPHPTQPAGCFRNRHASLAKS